VKKKPWTAGGRKTRGKTGGNWTEKGTKNQRTKTPKNRETGRDGEKEPEEGSTQKKNKGNTGHTIEQKRLYRERKKRNSAERGAYRNKRTQRGAKFFPCFFSKKQRRPWRKDHEQRTKRERDRAGEKRIGNRGWRERNRRKKATTRSPPSRLCFPVPR
jgi:hypothetical protein